MTRLARLFKQATVWLMLASLQLGTLVQTKEAYAQYVPYGGQPTTGQPNTGYVAPVAGAISGYTNDGTLFMGGQRIGNPHQILHDAQIPSFMTITATRYTYTNPNDPIAPNYGQGTLLQMSQDLTAGSNASVLLNRLYLTPNNPYPVVPTGTHNNYQTYQGVLQNAQQAGFLLTNADDGKTYAFKTLTAANRQAVDLLIRELPNTPQFRAAADPLGGGTGVRVTQNGDAVALAAYLATVKPYDYSWQPNFGAFGGQNPAQNNPYGGWANSNNFAPTYGEGDGPAQSFQAFIKQLQDSAVANDKKVRSQTSANGLDLSGVNPNSLFGEGYNLFAYGSNSNPNRDLENDFLRKLQAGQLTVGSADYLEASRIAQERYRIAYATRLETGKPLQYSMADAQRKANELKLNDVNPNELFGQGFDLFKYNPALRANGAAENALLAKLQSGQLTAGSADYNQATQIAQDRLRQAYSLFLSPPPPPKIPKWKLIAGVVVGAVLTFVTAGAAAAFIGPMMGATLSATGAVLTSVAGAVSVAGVAATAVGAAVGSFVGSVISTSITTGSFSKGLTAGVNSLKGGLAGIVVNTALAMAGISAGGLGDSIGGALGVSTELANQIGGAVYNTISGSITNTIIGNGSLGDNLVNGAINGVASVVAAQGAGYIAGANLGTIGTELAHGALGCATAAIRSQDCAAGAVGAVAGHLGAGWIDAASGRTLDPSTVVFIGGTIGGAVAAGAGSSDNVSANFYTGQTTGANAVENNLITERELKKALEAAKDKLGSAGTQVADKFVQLVEKLEIKGLQNQKEAITKYLDDRASTGGLSEWEVVALGSLYAANAALFPTNVLDVFPGGKGASGAADLAKISRTGQLIKAGNKAEDAAKIAAAESKTAQQIAGGHAFDKHVLGVGNPNGAEFASLGIKTKDEFSQHIMKVTANPTHSGNLSNGRSYAYDSKSNTIVIKDPKHTDGGTTFRPIAGIKFLDTLK